MTSVGLWIWSNSQLQTFYQTFLDRGRKSYILQDGNFSTFARTRPASTVRDPFVSHLRRRKPDLSRNVHVSKFVAWQVVSLMKNEQQSLTFVAQSRPALYFSQQLSSACNKHFRRTTSWSRKVKNAKYRPKTCNETTLRDKLELFVSRISPPLGTDHFVLGSREAGIYSLSLEACSVLLNETAYSKFWLACEFMVIYLRCLYVSVSS